MVSPAVSDVAPYIDPRPHCKISIFNEEYTALIDTGAVVSCIGDKVSQICRQANLEPEVCLANGQTVNILTAYAIPIKIGP